MSILAVGAAGTLVAGSRLLEAEANPRRIPISHPRREPLLGGYLEFGALSPGGSLYTVVRGRSGERDEQLLQVVSSVTGEIVGQLPGADAGGSIRETLWRDAHQLWVGVVELSAGRCVAAFRASTPAWQFEPDDCGRRPSEVHRPPRHITSPDGTLLAEPRQDRLGPVDFLDARGTIDDVRITAPDGRFVVQIGNVHLIGWAADGSLVVLDGSLRPHRITRAEIDRVARRAAT